MEHQTETTNAQESQKTDAVFVQFGEYMSNWGESFGQQMASWGQGFGEKMESWSTELEARLETWGQEFGPRLARWGRDLTNNVEKVGERASEWVEGKDRSSPAGADNLQKERLAILHMVQEGKINVSEAESLLRAVGK